MICAYCRATISDGARFCPVCGKAAISTETQAQTSSPALRVNDLVGREIAGRYRILAKLGEGGMGAVYRGEQISLKRAVAVKVLKPELSTNSMLVMRFNAEAEAVAKLSHPNTVNIYDFGQGTDGSLFIAMEFIEGRSLRTAMHAEGPFSPARALRIAVQIAASLTDAHAHSIVHRDLKPDNVMLQDRGRQRDIARVLDFGIAKLRDDSRGTAMTQAGDMLGTPQYMAPEQIRGDAIDGRTDIYALGCLIYEMVTGRLPFEATTVMGILSKHLLDPIVPPSQRRPELGLPPAIDQLVVAAMAKDPNARAPTMEQMGEQLAAVLATLPADTERAGTAPRSAAQPVLSPPPLATPAPTLPPPSTLQVRKSQTVIYGVVGAIVLAGAGVGIWAASRSSGPSKSAVVEAPAPVPPPAPAPTPTPVPAPAPALPPPAPAQDFWNGAVGSGSHAKTIERPKPKPPSLPGTTIAIGKAKLILPPGFKQQWSQGAVVATSASIPVIIAAGPMIGDATDGPTLARDYATQAGLTLDGTSSVNVAGTLRPAAALHGTLNGVNIAQAAFAFIGTGYRFAIVFTVAFDRRNDATLLQFGNDFLTRRVILP